MQTFMRMALVVLVLGASACRQADGPTPTPNADQQNEIGDLSRDLINLVNKDKDAPADLRSDLVKYATEEEATPQFDEFSRRLTDALNAGARLDDQSAQRLAHNLWVGLTATEYSSRQVQALQGEVKSLLVSVGVPENRAQPVADQLGEVQKAITGNPKRWYQVF